MMNLVTVDSTVEGLMLKSLKVNTSEDNTSDLDRRSASSTLIAGENWIDSTALPRSLPIKETGSVAFDPLSTLKKE